MLTKAKIDFLYELALRNKWAKIQLKSFAIGILTRVAKFTFLHPLML